MNIRKHRFGLSFFLFFLLLGNATAANLQIRNLTVEYSATPLGMDEAIPRFSWQMHADGNARNCYQTAYRLRVTDEKGEQVWDSGTVDSSLSLNIEYGGQALKATTRYHWQVEVWDEKGKPYGASSWFETGLMNPELSAWNGAQWIGGDDDDRVLYAPYLPVFKLSYRVQLDRRSRSEKAAFIYGANDPRLMDRYKNIYQIENAKDNAYIRVELDLTSMRRGAQKEALLHLYRVGYHPDDRADLPFKSVSIPAALLNETNAYAPHTFHLRSLYGATEIFMDGEDPTHRLVEVNLNPLGNSSDYIAFPMLADIGFAVPAGQQASFSQVEVCNYRAPSNTLYSGYAEPLLLKGEKNGKLLTFDPSRNAMPILRTTFPAGGTVEKARLYVTARGIYEFYINGERVGNDYFNPGLTQYNQTQMYQTYDVTALIRPGRNAMGAMLGEGWWSGPLSFIKEFWNYFGDRQSLLAQLVITYADGRQEVVVTNPDTWNYYNDGPIACGSFFQGEVYDARKEKALAGWNTADYHAEGWKKAKTIGEESISRDGLNAAMGLPLVDDYSRLALIGQLEQPVQQIKELRALSVEEVRPGVFVYDMGQNMVGVPKIQLSGMTPGQAVCLRFAEVLYPDLPEYAKNKGMLMLENIRGAMAQDLYITRGGEERIRPRFTFHGYRYVEITGIDKALPLHAVRGEVISSIHELASVYETSNAKVNKLWENITWSTYANFLSIPTDCPQRNERQGWGGDISVYSRTATYLAHLPQFLRKHMLAMRQTQREDGRFADIAPIGGGFGGILWGSAGITVPWESYRQYNDTRMLAEHYEAMKKYIDYLLATNIDKETGLLVQENPGAWGNLGDWLGLEDEKNDKTLLWEAYFIYDLQLMGKIAALLGQSDDQARFERLRQERQELFAATYLDPQTYQTIHSGFNTVDGKGRLVDIQTSYVLPLVFELLPEEKEERFTQHLVETITRENTTDKQTLCPPYSLMTGFIGTAWINKALSDNGRSDVAYRLLQQTSYPSWLYSVEQGATTIWERLNSYTHTAGFGGNNSMNSFNHYSFGAVGAWMYNYSLGIERDPETPAFKHFILQPEPDPTGQMTYARGHYDSMYGRIESSWEQKEGQCHYRFTVPPNTSATLYLPAASVEKVTENNQPLSSSEDIQCRGVVGGNVVMELPSGHYHFRVE